MKIYFVQYHNMELELMTELEYESLMEDTHNFYEHQLFEILFAIEFDFFRISPNLKLEEISAKKYQITSPV